MGRQSVDYCKARVVTSMGNGEYSTETSEVEKKRLGVTYLRGLCHDVQVVLSPNQSALHLLVLVFYKYQFHNPDQPRDNVVTSATRTVSWYLRSDNGE